MSQDKAELYRKFDTVYGLGPELIKTLIRSGAKTIADLHDIKFNKMLKLPTRVYLKYYDDLQERIPRDEIVRHGEKINDLLNAAGNFYKLDIVGSFRRGRQYSGDIDVLFTLTSERNNNPNTEYITWVSSVLSRNGYLIETLKKGSNVMNGIVRLTPDGIARRLDLFFSPPELYAFALLAKTGDTQFNQSLRACIKEKNPNYSLSELGIRSKPSKTLVGDIHQFQTEDSILKFIGVGKKQPHQMVGSISCTRSRQSSQLTASTKSRKRKKRRVLPIHSDSQMNKLSSSPPPNIVAYDSDATRLTPSPLSQISSHDSDATYE
jgi:DNA polymerase beta